MTLKIVIFEGGIRSGRPGSATPLGIHKSYTEIPSLDRYSTCDRCGLAKYPCICQGGVHVRRWTESATCCPSHEAAEMQVNLEEFLCHFGTNKAVDNARWRHVNQKKKVCV